MPVSVGFISLGCSKNLVDSQIMAGYLKSGKIALASSPETADVILINTCAFIDVAREEAAEAILNACEHKTAGGCRAVIVTGCMVQRYRKRLIKAFPAVDAFLGIDELEQISDVVRRVAEGKRCGVIVAKGLPVKVYAPTYSTLLFTGGPFAYLKIADGCNHRCAYCAIPNIRGHYRSRASDSILKEAEDMVRAGVKELNLVSQDSLQYGLEQSPALSIDELMRQIDAIDGTFRFRVLYGYPAGLNESILTVMNSARHLCKYLDLPVQHSHPDILRAMNRGKAVTATTGLAERLREAVPGVVLRTTCLVGFPGETAEHFDHLLEYVAQSKFDHLGVFAFSPEEETMAFEMDGRPAPEVTQERCDQLMKVQKGIVAKRTQMLVGTTDEVLLLRQETPDRWIGRLPRQAPEVDGETYVSGVSKDAKVGDFIEVVVTGGKAYDLEAKADMVN